MACKVDLDSIRQGIIRKAEQELGANPMPQDVERVNTLFKESLVKRGKIKEGVDFVFEQNPNLSNIGTKEEYSSYISSVFPDSKVKDIVYRGDKSKSINGVSDFLNGKRKSMLFLSNNKDVAQNNLYWSDFSEFIYKKDEFGNLTMTSEYEEDENKGLVRGAKNFVAAIVNITNPIIKNASNQSYRDYKIDGKSESDVIKEAKNDTNSDSLIVENVLEGEGSNLLSINIAIKNPEQIHILGNKQDEESFKTWKEQGNLSYLIEPSEELVNKYLQANTSDAAPSQGGFDTEIRNKYFKNSDNTTSRDILQKIANSSHPLKVLAEKLLNYSHIINSPISIIPEEIITINNGGEEGFKAAAVHRSDHSIEIAEFANFKGAGSENTLLHEIIHSYTVGIIDGVPGHPIVKELDRVLEYLRANKSEISDQYGLKNAKELVAEFFTNAKFISDLQKLPSQNKFSSYKNLWEEVLDYILSLFKLNRRDKNLYTELFPFMTNIVEEGISYEDQVNTYLLEQIDYDNFNQQQDEIYATYLEVNDYSEASNIDRLVDVSNEINDKYPEVFSQVIADFNNPNSLKVEPFSKKALPEEFSRRTIDGNLHSNEVADITNEILFKKLSRVFPQMVIREISEQDLIQEEHLVPIPEINSFVKGNTIFLVKGKFDTDSKIEEILHPFVMALYQRNKELFNNIYEQEKSNYTNIEQYYSKFSAEDAKIEVVTQALRDVVKSTSPTSKSYFQQFLSFLKRVFSSIFPNQPNNISPNSSIGDIANLILNSGYKFSTYLSNKPYYSASENLQKQLNDFNAIKNFAKNNGINKVGADEGYVDKNGNKVLRVTEEIDEKGSKMHKNPFTPEQEAFYTAGKNIGISAHAIYDDVLSRYIDRETGLRRAEKDVIPVKNLNGMSNAVYNKLEKAMLARLDTYPVGTRFLWEVVGYNPSYKQVGLAGTMDFIAFLPNGKKHLLDWKFISSFEKENIPGWKRDNYEFQLHNYIEMIKMATGAVDEDFEKVRIIPHTVTMNKDNSFKELQAPTLDLEKDVARNRRLLPYVSSAEYMKDNEIKLFIEKIKNIPQLLAKQEQVLTGSGRVDKDVDDFVQNAVNDFMLLGNLGSLYNMHEKLADDISVLMDDVKSATTADSIDSINSGAINERMDLILQFTQTTKDFLKAAKYIYGRDLEKEVNPGAKEQRFKDNIRKLSQKMNDLSDDYFSLQRQIIDKYAKYEGITNILESEKKVSGFNKTFTFATKPATRSVAFFSSLMAKVWPKLERDINDGYIETANLTHNIIQEQNKRGKSANDIIDMITDVDENGKYNGKLRTKFLTSFHTDRNQVLNSKDINVVKAFYEKWYDLDAYKAWYNEYIATKHTEIDAQNITEAEKKRAKKNLEYYYNIDESIQAYDKIYDSKYLKQDDAFKEKYYTKFYKDIEKPENLAVKEYYDYIINLNKTAFEAGLPGFNSAMIYTFIPNIPKGFIERGTDNFNILKVWKTFLNKFQVVPDAGLYGNVDPITMQLDKSVFVPFVYDPFNGDYSQKSKDIFRSFALFQAELKKAIAMKNLAPVADALLRVEQMKDVIPTSITGEKLWKRGQRGIDSTPIKDDTNSKYLQQFIDWSIYGRKIQESADKQFIINGKIYSLAKFLEGGMSWMYMNAFALNFLTPARAYVSAKASTFFLKGKDFNSKSLIGFDTFLNGIHSPKNSKFTALIGYFLPLIDNRFTKKADDLSINSLTSWVTPDNLTYFFDKGDRMSQLETMYTLLKNSIVIDGKLQNANRYINNLSEYSELYSMKKEDRKNAEKEIQRRIEEILQTNGILKIAKVDEKGNLSIPGIDSKEEAVNYFTNLVQFYTQKTTGQTKSWDAIGYKMVLLGRLAGQYKNWIPRTVAARLGTTRLNIQSKDYEWGRWLDFADATMRTFNDSWHKTASTILGFRSKEALIDYAKKQYIQVRSRVQKDGRQFTKEFVSEKDYIEQYLNNVNNTVNELRTIMTITMLLVSGLLSAGEGDDDETRSRKSFAKYQLSRLLSEFTFYINPFSFTDIFNKAIPMVTFVENFANLIKQMLKEFGGIIIDDQGMISSAHPIKAAMRALPVFSEFSKFIPLIDADLGKEMGIKPITTKTFF